MNVKALREICDNLFTKRTGLLLLWQEIAEHFYPERADFTFSRSLGTDFAADLMTSFPLQCRRELGDQSGQMLRPTATDWFHMVPIDVGREDNESKRWLEYAAGVQRRAMYDRVTLFTRAMKEADHDYAAFGQCVTSRRLNRNGNALIYRCWHLRDCAWMEGEEGEICMFVRKWKPSARDLTRLFGAEKLHTKVNERMAQNKPFDEFNCYHIVCEADMVDGDARRMPYFSVYYDVDNDHTIESVPTWNFEYDVARWQTVSGSQYAYSPATVCALADARLLQAMTYTLLEAGEKVVNPPIIAQTDVLRSDMGLYAGALTWVDREYDERAGDAVKQLQIDAKGMPLGMDMAKMAQDLLYRAFFLNRLKPFNPATDPQMTAFQAGQIVQDYIRNALPIFEPMEMERNGRTCEGTFEILLRNGAFGAFGDMPKPLREAQVFGQGAHKAISFRFKSPLHDMVEQVKGQKFLEMKSMAAEAIAMDPKAAAVPDVIEAFRDALSGIGVPAKWVRSEVTIRQMEDEANAQQQAAEMLQQMQVGSEVASNLGAAQKSMAEAGAA